MDKHDEKAREWLVANVRPDLALTRSHESFVGLPAVKDAVGSLATLLRTTDAEARAEAHEEGRELLASLCGMRAWTRLAQADALSHAQAAQSIVNMYADSFTPAPVTPERKEGG